MEEHVGGAVEAGQPLTVVGNRLEPGDKAPAFELDYLNGADFGAIKLSDLAGQVVVLNVLNSIDTPVCDVQTRRLDTELAGESGWKVSSWSPSAWTCPSPWPAGCRPTG